MMASALMPLLSALHPGRLIETTAVRLIPDVGYLLEYEHWGGNDPHRCHVAFIRLSKRSGGLQIDWSEFTHERRE